MTYCEQKCPICKNRCHGIEEKERDMEKAGSVFFHFCQNNHRWDKWRNIKQDNIGTGTPSTDIPKKVRRNA